MPAPRTIHRGVRKLLPGTLATWRTPRQEPEVQTYWSAEDVMLQGHAQPLAIGADDAVERLDAGS